MPPKCWRRRLSFPDYGEERQKDLEVKQGQTPLLRSTDPQADQDSPLDSGLTPLAENPERLRHVRRNRRFEDKVYPGLRMADP